MEPIALAGKTVRNLISPSTGTKIPVISSRGLVFSCWRPSNEELVLLAEGKPLWVAMRGSYIPEFSIIVGTQDTIIPRDVRMDLITGDEAEIAVSEFKENEDRIRYWSEWMARIIAVAVMAGSFYLLYFAYCYWWR